MLAELSIEVSSKGWWFIGISLVLGLLFLRWSYKPLSTQTPLTYLGAIAKLIAFLLILFILMDPVSLKKEAIPGSNQLAIMFDTSQTMTVKNQDTDLAPSERIQSWIESDGREWINEISKTFKTKFYSTDTQLRSIKSIENLEYAGLGSNINFCIQKLSKTYKDKPLAGIVVFTDGAVTDGKKVFVEEDGIPPVYLVPFKHKSAARDITLGRVNLRQSAFEDSPVGADIEVIASSLKGRQIQCNILSEENEIVFAKSLQINSNNQTFDVTANWKPKSKGLKFYRIEINLKPISTNPLDNLSGEITPFNNSQWIWFDHGQKPKRILYVSGRPNWEFKFLNRATTEDPLIDLVGLIRIAKREPKFNFKGRAGETSNPLFRGFDKQDEETEQYDQPVLKRLNIKDQRELSDGFPRNEEDLFQYDAIILDDLEADFFTRNQLLLIREFVNRRGGGLLMLGGMESMAEGGYQSGPLKDALPIYLNRDEEMVFGRNITLSLSEEGWLKPWARMRSNEKDEIRIRNELHPYQAANLPGRPKPGASVIKYMQDEFGTKLPALVTQRYGSGKSSCLMITDFWRPGMRSPEAMDDVKKSWRQILRWLTADVPKRIDLSLEQGEIFDRSIQANVKVLNKKFQNAENPSAQLVISKSKSQTGNFASSPGKEWTFELLPSLDKNATLETQFSATEPGAYRVKSVVKDANDIPIGSSETGWTSNPHLVEFKNLEANEQWMKTVSESTGGSIVELKDLSTIEDNLIKSDLPETITKSVPIWHNSWILLIALTLLLLEWSTRRIRGLA